MLGSYKIRTDLAVEARERFTEENVEVRGVEVREEYNEEKEIRTTVVKITTENGARSMGRPQGTYITIESEGLSAPDEDYHREVSEELSRHLRQLIGLEKEKSVLVVGLGNQAITADSLGPEVVGNLRMTRHLIREYGLKSTSEEALHAISGIVPGVMAQTGMETARILLGIIKEVQPDLVIAIDALAARSIRRLGTTIQLTDTGIHPGSGVGNHRHSLTKETLGIPVLAIGVPTVVGAAAIVHDTISALLGVLSSQAETKNTGKWIQNMDPEDQYRLITELLEPEFGSLYVTPPDIDERVRQLSFTISEGIHRALF